MLGLLILSILSISFSGLQFGVDFEGGTFFQLHLAEKASPDQMDSIRETVQQRLDWTGLKDTKVTVWGDEFVIATIAETDPETVDKLEALLKKQGKFEVTLDGNLLFTGSDIIQITKDPGKGYGFQEFGDYVEWYLPFTLKESAAANFTKMVFHKCIILSYDAQSGKEYECEKTYFFIDRPAETVLIIPRSHYLQDRELLLRGNALESIPTNTDIDDVLRNAAMPYFIVDNNLTEAQLSELASILPNHPTAILPPKLNPEIRSQLTSLGFELLERAAANSDYAAAIDGEIIDPLEFSALLPWVWHVSGARQVISLSEDVTNLSPYVADSSQARIFSDMVIRGAASDFENAEQRLDELTILLESGSLPVPIDDISKETVSPFLGKEFLQSVLYMGLVALIVVALVIFIRYRKAKLIGPLIFTGLAEVIIILGFASLIRWNLDLAAVAGLLAAVGTGVDNQIIITDELIRGEKYEGGSPISRVKRAFFIITATAATTIATMSPVILFSFGLGKLVGFAITIIVGVLIGVLITRPAYAEMAKHLLSD